MLSSQGIEFDVVDVLNDPAGREQLARLGARSVPVVARGGRFVFPQDLGKLKDFLGLEIEFRRMLSPPVLVARWTTVLAAAGRYLRQIPDAAIGRRVIENRDRSIRALGHHVFRICEAFLETASGGAMFDENAANVPAADGTCRTGGEIAAYGEAVAHRLTAWWQAQGEASCDREVETFYGPQSLHALLERSTWHSAQHVRQLGAALDRLGIEPDGRLAASDFEGLPLPEGLWE